MKKISPENMDMGTEPMNAGAVEYDTPALESALAKLRANTGEFKPRLLRDEAAALLAKIEAADRLEWQPIETAPKDGTPMLVCSHAGHVGRATYDAEERCFQDEHTEFIETRWLSAWMPLPPAYRNPQPTMPRPSCDLCDDTGVAVDHELGRSMGCPRGCSRNPQPAGETP
jgi:hypothetical protein